MLQIDISRREFEVKQPSGSRISGRATAHDIQGDQFGPRMAGTRSNTAWRSKIVQAENHLFSTALNS
jgi:hypothetical protein